jgi:hypothetical protein
VIYLVGDSVRGVCKIGWTSDFEKRIAILNQGYPFEFDIKRVKFGGIEDENKILEELRDYSIKGEWFQLTDAVVGFFDQYEASCSDDLRLCVNALEKVQGFMIDYKLEKSGVPLFKIKAIRRKSGVGYTESDVAMLCAYLIGEGE